MNVLSLFDGMACGLVALKRAGIKVDNYYASEIDKYAIQIAKKNHPEIIELGSIEDYESWNLPKIDLIIGGSPCQGFSFAGKQLNFDDPRSSLFFKFVECVWKFNPRNFLVENVKMKNEYSDAISELLEVEPVLINSSLVSAQNRKRLYWCNWDVGQPYDNGILLKDIIENDFVDRDKSHCIDANYFKGGNLKSYFEKNRRQLVSRDKSQTIPATIYKENAKSMIKRNKEGLLVALKKQNGRVVDITIDNDGVRPHKGDARKSGISELGRLMFNDAEKTYTVISSHVPKMLNNDYTFRKLTPIECERLQTLPDNYTEGVSNTQRYKMIGNGWTVDVIKHIFEAMPK